jgi:hypothetical protein
MISPTKTGGFTDATLDRPQLATTDNHGAEEVALRVTTDRKLSH